MAVYGYARVSTDGQSLSAQIAELKAAKCEKIFREKISGAWSDRKQLTRLMGVLAVSINAQPSLLPLDFVPENIRGGRLSLAIYQARAQAIAEHAGFRQRLARLQSDRDADRAPSVYVEEKIYAGFPASTDEALMHDFHEHCWSERPDIVEALEDGRFRELGKRVLATERPDLLSDQQSSRWRAWRRDRLLADCDVPCSTVATARAQIAELMQDSSSEQRQQLDEIKRLLVNMVA
ncbi:MAG: recombinase family protein [Bradyrhizobium sp.]|nr:recombinase family protein [Bradyrhizobium sp.]